MSRKDDDSVDHNAAPGGSGAAKTPRVKKRRTKPNASRYEANDKGGYGNPPVKSQFKPGNKGGGRKKNNITIENELRRVFRERIALADGSKTPMVRALAELLKKEILTNPKSLQWGLELAERYGQKEEDEKLLVNLEILNDAELNIYGALVYRMLASFDDFEMTEDITRKFMSVLGLYRVSMRDDGLPGIDQIKEEDPPQHGRRAAVTTRRLLSGSRTGWLAMAKIKSMGYSGYPDRLPGSAVSPVTG